MAPSPAQEFAHPGQEDYGEKLLELLEALLPLELEEAVLVVGVEGDIRGAV